MKPFAFLTIAFLILITLFVGIVAADAADYTSTFTHGEIVVTNQTYIQDPNHGAATPWNLYILSGVIGLILLAVSVGKIKQNGNDYEASIILSVMSWPFLWYWTWAGLTSVDRIVGTGMASVNGESVLITQHILYSFWWLGWIGVGVDVAAILVTVLLVGQFKLFRDNEENERMKQNQRTE